MKELKDPKQLAEYMKDHQLEAIFNEPLISHMCLFSYEKGELICSQGQPAQYLYVLVKGKIKVYNTSTEGKTLIISFKNALEMIGDIEYIQGADFINTVEAVTPVSMIGIHHQWLDAYGKDHMPLLKFLLKIITGKFYMKSNALSFNLMYPVEVRLASYILSVSFDPSDVLFRGQLSTSELRDAANLIGTSYRHLNRVILQLCNEGILERGKGYIHVRDRDRLTDIAGHSIYE
ncbi:cyclic nucleotide-binding domain-containing protein [Paenibacillus sp. HJL G12]|uniref:Cyclic nucleotide-binding domain-containing protein n=1 Tax=Paenibacillus dendrobii TaxID=2691084 RepID=A0A7X3IG37_9BACL|nr:cyclic nucleotide-binding domain-containing protein [Paenibacillus dendrobii]MWV42898.1 cyclic nucleotide-binding domain-containing protein [Paenibacillus dendrobii]